MTKYPNSECDSHRDVATSAPVCIVCMDREIEALRQDAERWRHARKLLTVDDLEGAQGAFDSFGCLVSEHECLRVDAAIDAAMAGANT